jgi:hypothetical protein
MCRFLAREAYIIRTRQVRESLLKPSYSDQQGTHPLLFRHRIKVFQWLSPESKPPRGRMPQVRYPPIGRVCPHNFIRVTVLSRPQSASGGKYARAAKFQIR